MQSTQTRHIVSKWVWGVLWCVGAVGAAAAAGCDVSVGDDLYRRETLVSGVDSPSGLAVDYASNMLYYHYYYGSWVSAKVDLTTKAVSEIVELSGECTFAVDQARREVHAGCRKWVGRAAAGLYQFDSNTGRFELAGEERGSVLFVYYKDALYYSVEPSLLLHTVSDGRRVRVSELPSRVYGLVIDKNADWIFHNLTGVYRQRAGAAGATRYEGFDNRLYALAADARGDAYVCDCVAPSRGIWRLHERATKLLDVWCTALTFDGDGNIIYGDRGSIVRLVKC